MATPLNIEGSILCGKIFDRTVQIENRQMIPCGVDRNDDTRRHRHGGHVLGREPDGTEKAAQKPVEKANSHALFAPF
jgi:hypothetical protein